MAAEPQRTNQPLVNGQSEEGSSKGNSDRDTVGGDKQLLQRPQEQEHQFSEAQQDSRGRAPPPQLNWPRTQGAPRPYPVGPQQSPQYLNQVPVPTGVQQFSNQQFNNQQQYRGASQQNVQNLVRRASPWTLLKAKIPGEQVQLQRGPEHAIYRMQNAPDPGGVNGGGPRPPSAGLMRMNQPVNLSRPPLQASQEGGMPPMSARSPYIQRSDSRTGVMGNPLSRPPSGMGMSGPMMRPMMRSSLDDDDDDVISGGPGSRPGSGMTRPPPSAPMQMRPNTPNRTPPPSPAPVQMPPPTRSPQPGRQPSLTSLSETSETPVTTPATSTTLTSLSSSNPVTAPSYKPASFSPRPDISLPTSQTTPNPSTVPHTQSFTKTDTITASLAPTVTSSITTPTLNSTTNTTPSTTVVTNSSPSIAPSTPTTAPSPQTNSVDASSKPPSQVVAPPQPTTKSKKMEERPPSVVLNEQIEEEAPAKRPNILGSVPQAGPETPTANDTSNHRKDESKKETVVNGSHDSPKRSPNKAPVPNKLGKVRTPSKSPSKISPKTPETPSSTDKKKVPMNKIQVGAAPSPNLKSVRSKIGSLDNAKHKPGGGNIKIETRKLQINAAPRIEAKNDAYTPGGGEKKIQTVKLHWEAKPKVGSLENAAHKPGGGDKKIESVKLDFKDKAKPKVGSKDNIKHQPGGGTVKNAGDSKEGSSIDIEDQKLEFKVESKVGSLDNVKHKPGGGEVKIFDDKEYIRQMTGSNSDIHAASSQGKRTRNSSTSRTRLSGSKSGTRENLSEDLSPDKAHRAVTGDKPPLPTTTKPMDQNSNQLSQGVKTLVDGSNSGRSPSAPDKEPLTTSSSKP